MKVDRKTDYCTCFPEGDWWECCWMHDHDCILALEYLSREMRLAADIKLYRCVKNKKKKPRIAKIMFIGVRLWAHTGWWLNYLLMKYYGRYF